MFRSVKPKTNKRRRVAEDEENTTDSYVDKDVAGVSTSTDRRSINTFSVEILCVAGKK